jgi:hypothetical protein
MSYEQPPRGRLARLFEAADRRHVPLRTILVTVGVVVATYLVGKLLYLLRDIGPGIDDSAFPYGQICPAGCLNLVTWSHILRADGHHRHQTVQGRHHLRQVSALAVPGGYRRFQVSAARAEEVPEHRRSHLIPHGQKPGDPLRLAGGVLADGTVSSFSSKFG